MREIAFILAIIGFVFWDVSLNRAQVTQPLAWYAVRVAGL